MQRARTSTPARPRNTGSPEVDSLSDWLLEHRQQITGDALCGAGGLETAAAYSDLVDEVVRRMFALACTRAGHTGEPDSAPLSVIATGGYGRRELCPASDVDITFVPQRDGDPLVDRIVKEMFTLVMRVFIDANRMEVGYAYRLLEDCLALDHQSTSGLLDARLICGSSRLFIQLEHDFWAALNPADYIFTKLSERREQRRKAGTTPHVVEPNLKEGPGGLRDIQSAVWVVQALESHPAARVRGERAWRLLARDGGISESEAAALADAKEFLFRVRNALHALTGEQRDQLVVTRQEEVASALGYVSERDNSPPVERFMRDLYRHLGAVNRISGDVMRRAENTRLFLGIGLDCVARNVVPANPALAAEDPVWMLWACELAQRYSLQFGDDLARVIVNLLNAHPEVHDRQQASEVFTRILASRTGAYAILQQMADLGILGWYIPEVGALMDLIPYDPSHDFTVGQHSLYVIRNLDFLRSSTDEETSDFRRILEEVPHVEQLYLAALLHDAGKSRPGTPHSESGEELAGQVCARLGWQEQASENVRFLVRQHLLMAETSRLRDLNLEETIRDFVAVVDDLDRLNMLYLLTYADTNAVGAGVWTQVKGRFLRDLHRRAGHAIAATDSDEGDGESLARTRRRLLKELAMENIPEHEVADHVESMPAPYILNTSLQEIALHIGFVRRARAGEPVVDFYDERNATYTEVTVCTPDDPKPGLLSKIAGILYAADLNVHSAQVFTRVARSDSAFPVERLAIDTLYVDYRGRQLTPGKRHELDAALRAVLTGETQLGEVLARRKKSPQIGGPVERLNVRNDLSETFTVVEVAAGDDRAMLYRASGALSTLGWDIHSARVSLFKGRTVASFYVTGARDLPESEARALLLGLMPVSPSRG